MLKLDLRPNPVCYKHSGLFHTLVKNMSKFSLTAPRAENQLNPSSMRLYTVMDYLHSQIRMIHSVDFLWEWRRFALK